VRVKIIKKIIKYCSISILLLGVLSIGAVYSYSIATGGYRAVVNVEETVDEWTVCKKVTNNNTNDIYVPTGIASDWLLFRNNATNVTFTECCTPDCEGKDCGDNGCGESCGACSVGSCDAWSAPYCYNDYIYKKRYCTGETCQSGVCTIIGWQYQYVDNCSPSSCVNGSCVPCECDWVGEGSICGYYYNCSSHSAVSGVYRRQQCDGCFLTGYRTYLNSSCSTVGSCSSLGCAIGYYSMGGPFGEDCSLTCPSSSSCSPSDASYCSSPSSFSPFCGRTPNYDRFTCRPLADTCPGIYTWHRVVCANDCP
jgi:hypothetical protein